MPSAFLWPVLVPSALRATAPVNLGVRPLHINAKQIVRRMKQLIVISVAMCAAVNVCAQEASQQADSFANIYASTCLKHLSNLDSLRGKLASMPNLPPEKASNFLQGQPGKAWPVPDKHGVFVLAIPHGKNLCTVFARRVNGPEAIARFQRLVASAPAPLTSRQTPSSSSDTQRNGSANTIGYEWHATGASRRLQFTLTTASSPTADIQGMASAAYVH